MNELRNQSKSGLESNSENELAFVKGLVNGFLLSTPIWIFIVMILKYICF